MTLTIWDLIIAVVLAASASAAIAWAAYRRALRRRGPETSGEILSVEPNIYDQEEIHENCTVQILKNSMTGACSVGWWENEEG